MDTSSSVLSKVGGTLSKPSLDILSSFAMTLDDGSMILDLYCGAGRSTVTMGLALKESGNQGTKIVAVDTHVTNPLSSRPQEDGTFNAFCQNIRHFKILDIVIPVVTSVPMITEFFNRKSFNLVSIQSSHHGIEDALLSAFYVAQHTIRAGGNIVVFRPHNTSLSELINFCDSNTHPGIHITQRYNDAIVYKLLNEGEGIHYTELPHPEVSEPVAQEEPLFTDLPPPKPRGRPKKSLIPEDE